MRRFSACASVLASLSLVLSGSASGRANDWPQWFGADRDGVWKETGLLQKFPEDGPKIRWRVPMGIGYSGPAVAGNKVYVMDLERAVDENGQPLRATRRGIPGTEMTDDGGEL